MTRNGPQHDEHVRHHFAETYYRPTDGDLVLIRIRGHLRRESYGITDHDVRYVFINGLTLGVGMDGDQLDMSETHDFDLTI